MHLRDCTAAIALAFLLVLPACSASETEGAMIDAGESIYRNGPASRDGIGKFYMGREISHVMGPRGAMWLERPEREREERTDLLIEALPLSEDSIVADIGAGTGYFSFRMAERVPGGKVLAVDIQQEMLDIVEARKANGAPANVETVLGDETNPNLANSSITDQDQVDA